MRKHGLVRGAVARYTPDSHRQVIQLPAPADEVGARSGQAVVVCEGRSKTGVVWSSGKVIEEEIEELLFAVA